MVAVGVAGSIGSGKTELARALHQIIGGVLVSFGDYVRAEATRRHLRNEREVLQRLGENLIEEQGWDEFCKSVLVHFGWHKGENIVIDGVRHIEVAAALRQLIEPQPFVLVLVELDDRERSKRLERSGIVDGSKLKQFEAHSTELQVSGPLAELAEMHVDGGRASNLNAMDIVDWLTNKNP